MAIAKIASAVGAVGAGTKRKSELAQRIETAMAAAVTDAYARGITDPKKVKALMLEARAKAKLQFMARG